MDFAKGESRSFNMDITREGCEKNVSRLWQMRKNGAKRRAQMFVILALGASERLWGQSG